MQREPCLARWEVLLHGIRWLSFLRRSWAAVGRALQKGGEVGAEEWKAQRRWWRETGAALKAIKARGRTASRAHTGTGSIGGEDRPTQEEASRAATRQPGSPRIQISVNVSVQSVGHSVESHSNASASGTSASTGLER